VEIPMRGDGLERPVLRERHPVALQDLVEEDLDPMLEAAEAVMASHAVA
jgi:hypothetical protein